MGKYDALFTPMTVGSTRIKNRIVMCPMGGTALIEQGKFEKKSADMYLERAKGGVGLIVTGIALVTDMWGRGGWLYEAREHALKPLQEFMKEMHSYDCKVVMQLGAGMGRVLSINSGMVPKDMDPAKAMIAPSELPNVWIPEKKHREMTKVEIEDIIDAFIKTAKFAQDGGLDGVEVHAIHEGYLLDQFSISATNHRTDEYGGSLENRLRFTTEIIKGIKKACGEDFIVSVRYSVTSKMKEFNSGALPGEDYVEFGRSLEQSPAVARILEDAGCDMLNADNGSYDSWWWAHPPMYMPMGCNLPEASYIKQFVDIPVICAGRMEDLDVALPAIENQVIDGIGLARQLLADADWPEKVQKEEVEKIRPCIACHNGCFGRLFEGKGTSCAVNPAAMQEEKYQIIPADKKKKIVVVGGGIGGMEVARVCAMRGHDVSLYEKSNKLGGVFIAAAAPDFKEADRKLIEWYLKEIKDLSIEVKLNTTVTDELLDSFDADEIIIATGAKPKNLPIEGIDGEHVIEAIDFLLGRKSVGENVVVIGGGLTGCEIAYDLVREGKQVSVVEMLDDILQIPGLSAANANMLRQIFKDYHVNVQTSAKLQKITPNGVVIDLENGDSKVIGADHVILAVGYDSYVPLTMEDKSNRHILGDAAHVGNLMDVIWGAYDLALAL
ncbi:MAG TPA: FAD-dependent oxidoreductase [Candidatus Merdenecus merdavium]|nr:FAD-dependent oxidoreductase [Candidatus Merdenecus merdavium]